jgi:uncharacterized membrane protein YgcG
MSRNRLLLAVPALLLLLLAVPAGCNAVVGAKPVGCQQAVFSPESAPAGSHYFGDGSGNMQLSAEDMATAFKQAAACDPFQISVREMAWGLEPIPDEAARFARQQYLASDLGALTEASKRVNQVVDSSTFTVNTDWSGSYETLYAAATQDGWRAYKLRKSMSHETVLVQKTAGNRTFIWKVICLWQPVAEILRGYPVGPPSGALPPGQSPPRVPTTGTTVPPGTNPPGTGTQPPHTTVTRPPHNPPPTTAPKCTGGRPICGTNGSGPDQQPPQDNDPDQVAPTPGYTPGGAEEVDSTQHGSGESPTPHGTDSGGGGGGSPGGSGSGSNGGSGGSSGTGNPDNTSNPNPGQENPGTDPGSW